MTTNPTSAPEDDAPHMNAGDYAADENVAGPTPDPARGDLDPTFAANHPDHPEAPSYLNVGDDDGPVWDEGPAAAHIDGGDR